MNPDDSKAAESWWPQLEPYHKVLQRYQMTRDDTYRSKTTASSDPLRDAASRSTHEEMVGRVADSFAALADELAKVGISRKQLQDALCPKPEPAPIETDSTGKEGRVKAEKIERAAEKSGRSHLLDLAERTRIEREEARARAAELETVSQRRGDRIGRLEKQLVEANRKINNQRSAVSASQHATTKAIELQRQLREDLAQAREDLSRVRIRCFTYAVCAFIPLVAWAGLAIYNITQGVW